MARTNACTVSHKHTLLAGAAAAHLCSGACRPNCRNMPQVVSSQVAQHFTPVQAIPCWCGYIFQERQNRLRRAMLGMLQGKVSVRVGSGTLAAGTWLILEQQSASRPPFNSRVDAVAHFQACTTAAVVHKQHLTPAEHQPGTWTQTCAPQEKRHRVRGTGRGVVGWGAAGTLSSLWDKDGTNPPCLLSARCKPPPMYRHRV